MAAVLVVFGDFPIIDRDLRAAAQEFDWQIRTVQNASQVVSISKSEEVVAVAFCHPVTRWRDVLSLVRAHSPRAKPLLCHRFADAVPWSKIAEAGVFYALAAPFRYNEVRQCLGFIWAARKDEPPEHVPEHSMVQTPLAKLRIAA